MVMALLAGSFTAIPSAKADDATTQYPVTFTVTDGTNPIVGANINLALQTLTTDSAGTASLNLVSGYYTYRITLTGYEPYFSMADVNASATSVAVIMTATPLPPPIPTYTVTFDAQGGTPTPAPITNITSGATITLPEAPTKDGFIFANWNTTIDGTGTTFAATTPVITDETVYAIYTATVVTPPVTYSTVIFDNQNGEMITFAMNIPYSATVVPFPEAPTEIGYTFANWNTAIDGTGTTFAATTPVLADITVYATYTATVVPPVATYTVTFVDFTPTPVVITGIISGATVELPPAPTKAGFTFASWNTIPDGSGTTFAATTPVIADIPVFAIFTPVAVVPVIGGGSPATVNLGTAGNFSVLAEAGISTTGTTFVAGDIGVSPIFASALAGFSQMLDNTGTFATSPQVTGKIYAADYAEPTPTMLTTAVNAMYAAYTDAATRTTLAPVAELDGGTIASNTILVPGIYKWSTNLVIPTDLTLNGGANDVWIFQIAGTLELAPGIKVLLSGGAQASNIFWQVGDIATLYAGAHFEGNILGASTIVLRNGASINGSLFSQRAVTLDGATIGTRPTPIIVTPDPTPTPATYTVTFDSQGGSAIAPITGITAGATITLPEAPILTGSIFNSWATKADGTGTTFAATTPVTADITVYASYTLDPGLVVLPVIVEPVVRAPRKLIPPVVVLPKTTLIYQQTFLNGYPDGTFRPDRNISRAEVAAALTRALGLGSSTIAPAYPDVPATHWAASAIQIMKEEGIMIGDTSGKFRPDAPITRAEVATALLRLLKVAPLQNLPFSIFPDVPATYWAAGYIAAMQGKGYINGYPDGTFKPTSNLLRAEATAILARVLGREISAVPQITSLEASVRFPDVPATHWAYLYILEASTPYTLTNAPRLARNLTLTGKTIPLFSAEATPVLLRKIDEVLTAIVPTDGLLKGVVPVARQVTVVITKSLKP